MIGLHILLSRYYIVYCVVLYVRYLIFKFKTFPSDIIPHITKCRQCAIIYKLVVLYLCNFFRNVSSKPNKRIFQISCRHCSETRLICSKTIPKCESILKFNTILIRHSEVVAMLVHINCCVRDDILHHRTPFLFHGNQMQCLIFVIILIVWKWREVWIAFIAYFSNDDHGNYTNIINK